MSVDDDDNVWRMTDEPPKLLADIFEAVIGAIYIDCHYSLSIIHGVLHGHMLPFEVTRLDERPTKDAITLWPLPLSFIEHMNVDDDTVDDNVLLPSIPSSPQHLVEHVPTPNSPQHLYTTNTIAEFKAPISPTRSDASSLASSLSSSDNEIWLRPAPVIAAAITSNKWPPEIRPLASSYLESPP
jgi:hypothetical protein